MLSSHASRSKTKDTRDWKNTHLLYYDGRVNRDWNAFMFLYAGGIAYIVKLDPLPTWKWGHLEIKNALHLLGNCIVDSTNILLSPPRGFVLSWILFLWHRMLGEIDLVHHEPTPKSFLYIDLPPIAITHSLIWGFLPCFNIWTSCVYVTCFYLYRRHSSFVDFIVLSSPTKQI